MAKKCAKNYKACAQPLSCSLNLLCGDALVAIAVVFCVRSLITASVSVCVANHTNILHIIQEGVVEFPESWSPMRFVGPGSKM